jgi:hypothetical protein
LVRTISPWIRVGANPNRFTLDGDIVITEQFNIEGIDQGKGSWGAVGSGADTEVPWIISGNGSITVIPEPATATLFLVGLLGIGWRRKR